MQKLIYGMVLLMTINFAVAQKPEKAIVSVKYAFSHVRDTNNKENRYHENMVLLVGKSASMFLSYDKIGRDIEVKKALEEQVRQQGGTITSIQMPPRGRALSNTAYYHFFMEGKVFMTEPLGPLYLVEYPLDKTDWKITTEKQQIEGIACTKATANFKGRNWTVWFAEDLPFSSGPWKLNGLPGLIIQAYDEKKEVTFDFNGLEKIEETKINQMPQQPKDEYQLKQWGSADVLTAAEIKLPENVVKATDQELNRLKEARKNDPQGFAKAQMAAMGMGGITKVSQITGPTGPKTTPPANVFNNPIEKKPTQ